MEIEEFVRLVEEMREAHKGPACIVDEDGKQYPTEHRCRLGRKVDDAIGDFHARTWAATR